MDIFFLLKVIWRKKLVWLIIPLITAISAYLLTLNEVDWYVASAQLSTGYTISDQVGLTNERFSTRDADIKFNNLLNSMNSGAPVNFISYGLLLHDLDSSNVPFHNPDRETFKTNSAEVSVVTKKLRENLSELRPLSTADDDFDLVRKFLAAYRYDFSTIRSGLTIKRVPNTDFIQVEFVSDNPELSALAVNTFCEEFIRFNSTIRSERSEESVEFLEELVASKKKDLDEKLETQRLFKSSNSLFNVEREGESKYAQLNDLEKQRDEIRNTIQRIEITRNKLNDQLLNAGGTGSGIVDNQKVLELRNTINKLNERYITGGQSNALLRDSISLLREQLRIQTDMQVTSQPNNFALSKADIMNKLNELDVEYQVSRSNLSSVDAKIRSLQYSFAGYASKEAKLAAIQQEIDLASKEYLETVNKFNEAKNKLLSSSTLRQINVAFPPLNPLASKRFLIIGLAAFSSLLICIFIIVLFEVMDQSIRSIEKFNSMIGLTLIGSIIKVNINNFNIPKIFNQSDENGEIIKSSLRKLRHELVSLNSSVILFTSLRRNEGKTFVIVALSYVLSLIDKRVLVVDTNFRNNMLSTILPKSQVKVKSIESRKPMGLIEQGGDRIQDKETDNDSGYELISQSIFKNIYVVTNTGGGSASPAEILTGRNFNVLIEKFRNDFDYIFLEGGALNDYADTKELVEFVDKVVTIFSAQATINQQDKVSLEYLRTLGPKFAGCVLNRIDPKDYKS